MSGRQGFITNHQTYVYQESPSTGVGDLCSASFGLDNSGTRIWRILVKNDDTAYIFTSGQFLIDAATNGNVTITPNGNGTLVVSSLLNATTDYSAVIADSTGALAAVKAAAGTTGQVLTSQGHSAAPIWATAGVSGVSSITGDSGGALVGALTITGAGGITTSGAGTTLTITGTGLTWTRPTTTPIALVANHGYVQANAGAGLTTFTLPATAALGTEIQVIGESSGGWSITTGGGQSIQYGNLTGATSLGSTNRYDCVRLVCRVANTTWVVTSAVGVLNVA